MSGNNLTFRSRHSTVLALYGWEAEMYPQREANIQKVSQLGCPRLPKHQIQGFFPWLSRPDSLKFKDMTWPETSIKVNDCYDTEETHVQTNRRSISMFLYFCANYTNPSTSTSAFKNLQGLDFPQTFTQTNVQGCSRSKYRHLNHLRVLL